MAIIMGSVNKAELEFLQKHHANYEMKILSKEDEKRIFGQNRDEDDPDQFVSITMDMDIVEVVEAIGLTWEM